MKFNPLLFFLLIILDAIVINVSIILSFLIRFGGTLPEHNFAAYKNIWLAISLIHIIMLYVFNLYNLKEPQPLGDIQINIFKACTISILISIALTYVQRSIATAFPTTIFAISWLVNILMLFIVRVILHAIIHYEKKVIIIGRGEESGYIAEEISKNPKWGYNLVDYISEVEENFTTKACNIIKNEKIDEIILVNIYDKWEDIWKFLLALPPNVKVKVLPGIYEAIIGKIDTIQLEAMPFIELNLNPIGGWNNLAKRLIDILFSIILLVILFVPMVFISILIKLTSKGSIFYKQERVGKDEKIFNIYKFRTMYKGAEDKTGPVLATKDDKRITPVGKVLRMWRLDELPQLFNVLKGDMSLVGPRPERPYFVAQFKNKIPGYVQRFKVKPGLTGLAQVNSAYDISPENKLKYDLLYIRNYSLSLDFKILLKTLFVITSQKSLAY